MLLRSPNSHGFLSKARWGVLCRRLIQGLQNGAPILTRLLQISRNRLISAHWPTIWPGIWDAVTL